MLSSHLSNLLHCSVNCSPRVVRSIPEILGLSFSICKLGIMMPSLLALQGFLRTTQGKCLGNFRIPHRHDREPTPAGTHPSATHVASPGCWILATQAGTLPLGCAGAAPCAAWVPWGPEGEGSKSRSSLLSLPTLSGCLGPQGGWGAGMLFLSWPDLGHAPSWGQEPQLPPEDNRTRGEVSEKGHSVYPCSFTSGGYKVYSNPVGWKTMFLCFSKAINAVSA